jgi:hypothetical protein
MSASPAKSIHAPAWTVAILAAPLLYVLSVPPVRLLTAKNRTSDGYVPRQWAKHYAKPYYWLRTFEPLAEPLNKYHRWWFDLTAWTYTPHNPSHNP